MREEDTRCCYHNECRYLHVICPALERLTVLPSARFKWNLCCVCHINVNMKGNVCEAKSCDGKSID